MDAVQNVHARNFDVYAEQFLNRARFPDNFGEYCRGWEPSQLYAEQFPKMEEEISDWIRSGKLSLPEQIEKGIESFPAALVKLMDGGHKGKLLVEP